MTDTSALHEIHALHVLIEDWFNARIPACALDTLMAPFSDDFSMVGIAGQRLDRDAVQALFAGSHGARPGLVIAIEAVQATALPSPFALLRYREGQGMAGGAMGWRESLAVLRQEHGHWRWVALHETPSR
ncbi:DUF4440 domain-containing protein [Stenotrophomonas sp.]|uniref:DUF4440 domain-containing protein n=1 Tax=Stenotrophomonas sp. TaxID=69392 RepID=UPI002FCC7C35